MTETETHRVRWFVYAGHGETRERIPRTASMRGQWGYDVECSCGWATHSGGAVRSWIEGEIWLHKRGLS